MLQTMSCRNHDKFLCIPVEIICFVAQFGGLGSTFRPQSVDKRGLQVTLSTMNNETRKSLPTYIHAYSQPDRQLNRGENIFTYSILPALVIRGKYANEDKKPPKTLHTKSVI